MDTKAKEKNIKKALVKRQLNLYALEPTSQKHSLTYMNRRAYCKEKIRYPSTYIGVTRYMSRETRATFQTLTPAPIYIEVCILAIHEWHMLHLACGKLPSPQKKRVTTSPKKRATTQDKCTLQANSSKS